MQTVGWSPLFESREQRALTPLKTIEAMAQKWTAAGSTCSCPAATSDCPDTEDDCEEGLETAYGVGCDTVDLTCGCDSWFAPCDEDTLDIAGCDTRDATCYETDPDCAEPTSDTCRSDYPTCSGDTCDSTCEGRETCDITCYDWDPNCAETVADTCETCEGAETCDCGPARFEPMPTSAAATCDGETCDDTCDTCSGETCDAFPCEDTWDDTCDCGTVVTTCEGVATCDGTCVTGAAGCTYDSTCSGDTCEGTCVNVTPGCTYDATCSGETCDTCQGTETCEGFECQETVRGDTCYNCETVVTTCEGDTCDDTCITGTPGCTYDTTCSGETCDYTCDADDPDCEETVDYTCDEGDPDCKETVDVTCYPDDPDCKETVDVTCDADDPDCKETVDDTCDRALPTCDDTCASDLPTCDDTCDTTLPTCDDTCDRALPTCDFTCDTTLPTCDDTCDRALPTCDFTCDPDLPFCDTFLICGTFDGHTCDFCFDTVGLTCHADDPACPGDTIDVTCAWGDPDCADATLDCPHTWDCEATLDCPERPEVVMDFGDAPDPSRHTRLADDGARHIVDEEYYLGLRIDEEPDGQPNPAAIGDDIPDRRDDEDGVWFTTSLLPGRNVSLIVEASTEGYLDAWVDSDNDGDWGGAGEQIFVGQPLSAGFNVLSFEAPRTAVQGPAFSRFRFSSWGYLSYTGVASDGEVEDHYLPITEAFGAAIKTDKTDYTLGEDATVTFYVNEAAEVRLVEGRPDERPQVLWSGTVNPGTQRLWRVPITGRIGRGTVALVATSLAGSTTMVSTPFDVAQP